MTEYADNDYSTKAVLSRLNLQGMHTDDTWKKDPVTGMYGPTETAKSKKKQQNRETQKKRKNRVYTPEQKAHRAQKARERYKKKHPEKLTLLEVIQLRKLMGHNPISYSDTTNIREAYTVRGLTPAPNGETIVTHATNLQSRRERPQEIRAREIATDDTRVRRNADADYPA